MPSASTPRASSVPGGNFSRAEIERRHHEALARLERHRATRLLVYAQIRKCLEILGDSAAEVVGSDRLEALRRESEALSVEAPSSSGDEPAPGVDPGMAWAESEPDLEDAELPFVVPTPRTPSPEELKRARETLRDVLTVLDQAENRIPELHLDILRWETLLQSGKNEEPALDPVRFPSGGSTRRGRA